MCYENLGENPSCQSSELLLYLGGAAEVTNGYNNGEQKKHKLGYTPCNFGYISTYTWNCTSKQ